MQRFFPSLAIAALLAASSGAALAEDGGRGPAGGAFMSSYSTPPAPYAQPYAAPSSAFAVQTEPREVSPRVQRRRARQAR